MIEIFTDGSSQHNGKPHGYAGWSMVAFVGSKKIIRYGHLAPPASNNRGEIGGVLFGVMTFVNYTGQIKFISDSQYVVKSINEWRHKHKHTGYLGIKNEDMLSPLYQLWDKSGKFKIQWVKGHSGVPGNELADQYAGLGCQQIVRNIKNENYDIQYVPFEEFSKKLQNVTDSLPALY